jgi:spore germination protein KB
MLEKGKISIKQFTLLVILFTVGTSILIVPSGLASHAKKDAWIAAILGTGIGLLFVWLYTYLGKYFPKLTFVELSEKILGKWLGKIVSLLFFTYVFILASLLLRNIGDFLITQILPETPIQAINILFLGIVILGTRLRIEVLGRTAEIFFPWVILFFFILVVSVSPQIKWENIQPMFEGGIKPIMRGAIPFVGTLFMQLVVFLMITPYVDRTEKVKKGLLVGTLIGSIILIIVVALSILVIDPSTTAIQMYPSYVLAKTISIGHFFQRVESLMAGIWFISSFFNITVCFYSASLGLAQTLKLKDFNVLMIPLGTIMIVFSILLYPNTAYFLTFLDKYWTYYASTYSLFLPVLILLVLKIRMARNNSKY